MKINKILLFTALAVAGVACSGDDDTPQPQNLENVSLSLSSETKVIDAPAALLSSQDEMAMQVSAAIAQANAMSNYFSLFTPPSNAEKSSTPIIAANGRSAAAQKEYLVYVWSHAQYGSIAYQLSEESDKYVFELFFKSSGQTDWFRYIYAEEKKDKSQGLMNVYDPSYTDATILASYRWGTIGDIFTFNVTVPQMAYVYELTFNTKTKSGEVVISMSDVKLYEMTWDVQGNGTWIYYDEEGAVSDTGSWTV